VTIAPYVSDHADRIRPLVAAARETWGETGEIRLDTGLRYADGEAVEVLVRKRGHRYDITDEGQAVGKAGVSGCEWLPVAERVVADEWLNVNRRGVVFVGAVEGRDLATLAVRIGDASRALYNALLDLED
jgi:hypothetical protein